MIDYFARHPVAANLLMLLVLGLGLFFAPQVKNTMMPDIDIPSLEVVIEWPGAGAEAITTQLLEPIESRLRQLDGIRATVAHAALGQLTINLMLDHDVDVAGVKQDVLNAIDSMRQLPSTTLAPRVRSESFDERALRLGLTGASGPILHQEALAIQRALLDRGIPKVEIHGWSEPQLEITVSGGHLQALDMSLDAIAAQIGAQLNTHVAGNMRHDGADLVISGQAGRLSENALENMQLAGSRGMSFRLGDVARIGWRHDREQIARVNGEDGIVITLLRSRESDTLEVSRITRSWLDDYRRNRPSTTVTLLEDASETVLSNRNMLIGSAVAGLVIVFAVLYLVLGRHAAFWTAAGIPVVVLGTIMVLLVVGHSINMFTIAAFIMVLGLIVDDAIIISEGTASESAHERPHGSIPSVTASKRMASPVLAAALTSMAAFAPLLLLPGYLGAAMAPIAAVVIAAISISLVECFLILPAHLRAGAAAGVTRSTPPIGDRLIARARRAFEPLMRAALAQRKRTLVLAVAGLAVSALAAIVLFDGSDSDFDMDALRTIVYLEPTTPRSERLRIIEHLEETLQDALSTLGEAPKLVRSWTILERESAGNPWLESTVSLIPSTERSISSSELMRLWGERLQPNPWVRRYGMETASEKSLTSISWTLSGRLSLHQLRAASDEFSAYLRAHPEILHVEDSFGDGAKKMEFSVAPQGRALGLDEAEIARQLHSGFEGVRVGQTPHGGVDVEIRVKLPVAERSIDRIAQFPVRTEHGTSVPLWSVADLRQQPAASMLPRVDGHPEVKVTAHLWPAAIHERESIKRRVEAEMLSQIEQRYDLQRGQSLLQKDQRTLMNALFAAFFISCFCIYLIMVWSLQSFAWPLLIMAVIPLGIAGAVFAHLLTGVQLGFLSVFGIVGMIGVVVNDAIIYLVRYRELRGSMPTSEALVQAGSDRFRAIVLTTATTVLGATPLLLDSSPNAAVFKPLLVSFAGGLLAAPVLLLLVLPSLLSFAEERWLRRSDGAAIDAQPGIGTARA